MRSVFNQIGINSTQYGSYQLVYSLFILCQHNGHGGAIFFSNYQSNCSFFFCTFDRCSVLNKHHGGCVAIVEVCNVLIKSVCFYSSTGWRCPGIMVWGDGINRVQTVFFNFSSDSSHSLTEIGSCFYSKNQTYISKCNFSNLVSSLYCSGIHIGCTTSGFVAECVTMKNLSDCGAIGFHTFGTPEHNSIQYFNFITCSLSSNGYMIWSSLTNTVRLFYCVFMDSSFNSMYKKQGIGSIEIRYSIISNRNTSISYSDVFLIDSTFHSNPTAYYHQFINTKTCWDSTFNQETTLFLNIHFSRISSMFFIVFLTNNG